MSARDAVEARMRLKLAVEEAAAAAISAGQETAEAIRDKDLSVTTNPPLIVTTSAVDPVEDGEE